MATSRQDLRTAIPHVAPPAAAGTGGQAGAELLGLTSGHHGSRLREDKPTEAKPGIKVDIDSA